MARTLSLFSVLACICTHSLQSHHPLDHHSVRHFIICSIYSYNSYANSYAAASNSYVHPLVPCRPRLSGHRPLHPKHGGCAGTPALLPSPLSITPHTHASSGGFRRPSRQQRVIGRAPNGTECRLRRRGDPGILLGAIFNRANLTHPKIKVQRISSTIFEGPKLRNKMTFKK